MISGDHFLLEAVAHLEGLVVRLEAGEPVGPFLEAFLEQQERLLAFPMQEDVAGVRQSLARLRTDPSSWRLRELKVAVDAALASAAEGPTRSPRANRLLGMALAALEDGSVPFVEEASAFHEDLGTLASRVTAVARTGSSDLAREEAGRLALRVDEAQGALEGLVHAVEEAEAGAVREAGEALVVAVRGLGAVEAALEELASREGRTPCVRCGEYNPGDRSTCERCGAILPTAAVERASLLDLSVGEPAVGQTRMTETLSRLFGACDGYAAGVLEAEAFLGEVAALEARLGQARRMGFGDAEAESKAQGLEEFEAGLAVLRQAGETGETGLLETGRRLLWEGAGKLQA